MPRKKRCPNCGSKKVRKEGEEWRCRTCGNTWSGKTKRSGSKKEKIRFEEVI
jgi:ribosomal protein L37AE/L43A